MFNVVVDAVDVNFVYLSMAMGVYYTIFAPFRLLCFTRHCDYITFKL